MRDRETARGKIIGKVTGDRPDRGRTFLEMRILWRMVRHPRSRRGVDHEEPLPHPACDQVQ